MLTFKGTMQNVVNALANTDIKVTDIFYEKKNIIVFQKLIIFFSVKLQCSRQYNRHVQSWFLVRLTYSFAPMPNFVCYMHLLKIIVLSLMLKYTSHYFFSQESS